MRYLNNFYSLFYFLAFAASVITGMIFGFTGDSHTGPIPYGIELITLIIGAVLWIIDARRKSPRRPDLTKIHIIGMAANGAVTLVIVLIALM